MVSGLICGLTPLQIFLGCIYYMKSSHLFKTDILLFIWFRKNWFEAHVWLNTITNLFGMHFFFVYFGSKMLKFRFQVSTTSVKKYGTLLQDAVNENKTPFVRLLLQFG